jgi:hypothetical protein
MIEGNKYGKGLRKWNGWRRSGGKVGVRWLMFWRYGWQMRVSSVELRHNGGASGSSRGVEAIGLWVKKNQRESSWVRLARMSRRRKFVR